MKRILIFAGTTEGRRLAEHLAGKGVDCTVCVATEYGEQIMIPDAQAAAPSEGLELCRGRIEVHQGRMDVQKMTAFLEEGDFAAVVDATHPYAKEVSENIVSCTAQLDITCLRLQREMQAENGKDAVRVANSEECAAFLKNTEGNILLTTGSKELPVYCRDEELRSRLYVRVLPCHESLSFCYDNGLAGGQIIAMQGPFSEEMNLALIRQYQIHWLVTKESGAAGGFSEKMAAAGAAGIQTVVICNPEKGDGLSMAEVLSRLGQIIGSDLGSEKILQITLAGAGMGSDKTMTAEVNRAIAGADIVFGAKGLLERIKLTEGKPGEKRIAPYYLAEDIIPCLEDYLNETGQEKIRACVLFSGDSGFYSGCQSVLEQLKDWGQSKRVLGSGTRLSVDVLPGISSVSCLAAKTGVSWQDARIISLHGREEPGWRYRVISAVHSHYKTFLLLSGNRQLEDVRKLLAEGGLSHCRIWVGYQLSCEEEEIWELTPEDSETCKKEGLYTCLLLNPLWRGRKLTAGLGDEAFLRGKTPMTKEEVRTVSISKLHLTEGAVVYDIGSGTGSVAVEMGRLSPDIRVYALERDSAACSLILANCERFGLDNVCLIHKEAPEGLEALPPATHAFIGGSGGRLKGILSALYEKNPGMRVVVNAVSLETAAEIRQALDDFPVIEEEVVQLQVSRSRQAGRYHMMRGENPVLIAAFTFAGGRENS